jgi:predicted MPP superfamily phosphohydrolase
MKLRYFSDLHLEFVKKNEIQDFIERIPQGLDEICILAGDIGNPNEPNYDIFMNYISQNFKKAFVIAGNHEYYNKDSMKETNNVIKKYFVKFNNISFLDNSFEHYENHCFIGTTLWSKITQPEYEINDIYNIPNFDYKKCNGLNNSCINFIIDSLENENCILITHHLPSGSLINKRYLSKTMIPYNQWYYSDLDHLIEMKRDKIKCWIYGHTHIPSSVIKHGIPFLCNPIGYPQENSKVDFSKVVEIP